MLHDLIIIGASAAGVSAALYAQRRNLNFLLISEDIGGEVATSGEIENYLGFTHTDGIELSGKFKEQLAYNGIKHQEIRVEKVEKQQEFFLLHVKQNGNRVEFKAKTIIIATGAHPRELSVKGEKEFRNKGVSYCTICDGPLFKNKAVITIGGGNSGLESALMLENIASRAWLLQKGSRLSGDDVLIDKVTQSAKIQVIYNAGVYEIFGDTFVKGLFYFERSEKKGSRRGRGSYKDTATSIEHKIEADGIFVHIGMIPNTSFIDFIEKNKFGEIIINGLCQTNIPGIFAAGDVTNIPYKQISIAAGHGASAALAAVDFLNKLKV